MFNLFTDFLPKRPDYGCSSMVPLPELPTGVKRMLRIQAKTFIDYIEDADQISSSRSAVQFLERCFLKGSDRNRGNN